VFFDLFFLAGFDLTTIVNLVSDFTYFLLVYSLSFFDGHGLTVRVKF